MTAHAEWKYFGKGNAHDVYIDYSSIKTEGLYKSMWYLDDFKLPEAYSSGEKYASSVAKIFIDCKASKITVATMYGYSQKMGNGKVVFLESPINNVANWVYPPPNSIHYGLIKEACGRK